MQNLRDFLKILKSSVQFKSLEPIWSGFGKCGNNFPRLFWVRCCLQNVFVSVGVYPPKVLSWLLGKLVNLCRVIYVAQVNSRGFRQRCLPLSNILLCNVLAVCEPYRNLPSEVYLCISLSISMSNKKPSLLVHKGLLPLLGSMISRLAAMTVTARFSLYRVSQSCCPGTAL